MNLDTATTADNPPHLLVVEDEPDIAALLALHLAELPAQVSVVHDGREGLRRVQGGGVDALVLDLRLPSMGGLDVCRALRESGNAVPILMLTARASELDRVLGLELGADDYLAKPFSVLELQARVKALLPVPPTTTCPARTLRTRKAQRQTAACSKADWWSIGCNAALGCGSRN